MTAWAKLELGLLWAVLIVSAGCDDEPGRHLVGDLGPAPLVEITIEQCEPVDDDVWPSPACTDVPRPVGARDGELPVLTGRWTLCSGTVPSRVGHSSQGAVGIEFTADGGWAQLHMQDGQLSASTKETESGRYALTSVSIEFCDKAGFDAGADGVRLSCGPHQLAFLGGTYARGPGRGEATRLRGVAPQTERCGEVGTPVPLPPTAGEAMRALSGRWQACPGALGLGPIFSPPDGRDFGIELMPNGDWWRLQLEDGQVVRGGHVADVGSWAVEPDDPVEGGWWINQSLYVGRIVDPDGTLGGTAVITKNPRKLLWYNYSIENPMVFVSLDP